MFKKVKVTINPLKSKLLLCMACLFLSAACQPKAGPSTIVIAVDRLPVQTVNCVAETNISSNSNSGFQSICQNSVRFTHAYTTSLLSAPALASILTGKYPLEHQLRNNSDMLKSEQVTVAELALKAGYRTALFTGGSPVLTKTGLAQGFENFDENLPLKENQLSRKFKASLENFYSWIRNEVQSDSFFAVFYVSDLNFVETQTTTDLGEVRNLSYESQLEELDSRLHSLIDFLKQQNIWDETRVVLVGLTGDNSNERSKEFSVMNLHTEGTQVSFLIKPSRKARDLGLKWSVDTNVSIADLGATLNNWFKGPVRNNPQLPLFSLNDLLSEKNSELPENRKILIESAWASWKGLAQNRYGLLEGQWFFLFDEQAKLFNTLTDRLEQNPILDDENDVLTKMKLFCYRLGLERYEGLESSIVNFMRISYADWTLPARLPQLKATLSSILKDRSAPKWISETAMAKAFEIEDWNWLSEIANRAGHKDLAALALSYTKKTSPIFTNECLKSLNPSKDPIGLSRDCQDPYFLDFYNLMTLGENVSDVQRKKSFRIWNFLQAKRKAAMTNIALGQVWDISESLGTSLTPSEILVKTSANKKLFQSFLTQKVDK